MDYNTITERVFAKTELLVNKFHSRRTGSEDCLGCADALYEDLHSFADSAQIDDFKVHAGAFLGWIRLLVIFYIIATVFIWFDYPLLSGLLHLLGILIMVKQFFQYKHFVDFLYPAKTGKNVYGTVEPVGEVKQQIIISGHHDAAHIFNFFVHQPKLYALRVSGGISCLIALCLLSFVWAIFSLPNIILGVISSAVGVLVLQLWFFESNRTSPGAGDNLISSCMAIESLRTISEDKKNNNPLKHTRVVAVSFDAEEEGLRGAYAFAHKHHQTLSEVPTYLFNMDCPYYLEDMFFLTSDINTTVTLSEDFAKECQASATALGYKTHVKPIAFLTGGTDAGELAKVGVHATTMMAMPWNNHERASVYHTSKDTLDAVEKGTIKAGLEIFYDLVKKKDAAVTQTRN